MTDSKPEIPTCDESQPPSTSASDAIPDTSGLEANTDANSEERLGRDEGDGIVDESQGGVLDAAEKVLLERSESKSLQKESLDQGDGSSNETEQVGASEYQKWVVENKKRMASSFDEGALAIKREEEALMSLIEASASTDEIDAVENSNVCGSPLGVGLSVTVEDAVDSDDQAPNPNIGDDGDSENTKRAHYPETRGRIDVLHTSDPASGFVLLDTKEKWRKNSAAMVSDILYIITELTHHSL